VKQNDNKIDLKVWVGLIIIVLLLGSGGVYWWLTSSAEQQIAELEYGSDGDVSGIDWSGYTTRRVALKNSLTIADPGVYVLSGEIGDGSLTVDANGPVKLVLDNVKITNTNGPAINITQADGVVIYLPGGSSSSLTDGGDYATQTNATADGTIYSKSKLIFDGAGELEIKGVSQHAIVAKGDLEFYDGKYKIIANQDAINGKQMVAVYGGEFEIEVGDDGIHADSELQLEAAVIDIVESCEGLEAPKITIYSGEINVVASDDGINAADGDTTSSDPMMTGNCTLTVNGGNVKVNASGDGLDANGSIYLNGGTVIVQGPTSGADGALDYDGELKVTGGTLLAIGSSQMAQGISSSSTQYGVMANLANNYTDGTKIEIVDDDKVLYTFTSEKSFSSIVYSGAELTKGGSYKIKINNDVVAELTIEDILTTYGTVNQMGPGGMKGGGMRGEIDEMKGDFGGDFGGERPEMMDMPNGEKPGGFMMQRNNSVNGSIIE